MNIYELPRLGILKRSNKNVLFQLLQIKVRLRPLWSPTWSAGTRSAESCLASHPHSHMACPNAAQKIYPLVICYIAIENDHRNSGFSHWTWWFSIVMLVYQRALAKLSHFWVISWSVWPKALVKSGGKLRWLFLWHGWISAASVMGHHRPTPATLARLEITAA